MARIFISYRREDSQYAVDRIYDALRRRLKKRDIFMDVDDIPKGVDFVDYLSAKVAQCETLVAVIGPQWLSVTDTDGRRRLDDPEDFVRIEIAAALKRGIPVVPVLLDGTPMPTAPQLPEDMRGFERRNGAEVHRRTLNSDIEALVRDLGLAGGRAGAGLYAALAAIALIGGGAAAYFGGVFSPSDPPLVAGQTEEAGPPPARQPEPDAPRDAAASPAAIPVAEAPGTTPDAAETLQPSLDIATSESVSPGDAAARTEAIRALQTALRDLGLYSSGIDGAAGPGTQAAAARFASETNAPAIELETATLDEIAASTARVEAEAIRRAERESAAWSIAQRTDTIAAYRAYLADYPAGANVSSANSRIRALEREAAAQAEAAAWSRAQTTNTIAAYQAYLRDYPSGANVSAARTRIAALTPPPEPEYRAGDVFRDPLSGGGQGPEMVVIPSGSFSMGSPAGEAGRDEDEDDTAGAGGRQRTVRIGYQFAVGKYEVTVSQYRAFAEATGRATVGNCWADLDGDGSWSQTPEANWTNPGFAQTGTHPVVCVSWDDARAYADWLSRQTGETYRLLSEAEFEYANRAGTTSAFVWGTDQNGGCGFANGADASARRTYSNWTVSTCDDGHVHTAPVGQFRVNGFGLHDMTGNVWEWTQDCYVDSYSGAQTDGSARVVSDCSLRVLRGGSWISIPQDLRSAFRGWLAPQDRVSYIGFRVARTL